MPVNLARNFKVLISISFQSEYIVSSLKCDNPQYSTHLLNGLSQKNPNRGGVGGFGHGISRGIKETVCGTSTGQLKNKWNFQG